MVEHRTFNPVVVGSSPTASMRPHRLVVRTPAFQAGDTGSNPVGVTQLTANIEFTWRNATTDNIVSPPGIFSATPPPSLRFSPGRQKRLGEFSLLLNDPGPNPNQV